MKKILILCTGNSCRSQMAEGLLKNLDRSLFIHSAGTKPEKEVNPKAVIVMAELNIDISKNKPELVDRYVDDSWDYVITVCDNAKEICPIFTGQVVKQLHIGFDDPADATGSEEEQLIIYRRIRDEIQREFTRFYQHL